MREVASKVAARFPGSRLCSQNQPQRVRMSRRMMAIAERSTLWCCCGWALPQPRSGDAATSVVPSGWRFDAPWPDWPTNSLTSYSAATAHKAGCGACHRGGVAEGFALVPVWKKNSGGGTRRTPDASRIRGPM